MQRVWDGRHAARLLEWTTMGGGAGLCRAVQWTGAVVCWVFQGLQRTVLSAYRPLPPRQCRHYCRLFTALIQLLAGLVAPFCQKQHGWGRWAPGGDRVGFTIGHMTAVSQ